MFEELEAAGARWNVLSHPFYVRWSRGELSREELSFYAGEYRHAVVALAAAAAKAAAHAPARELRAELERHADEERDHVSLWDDFAAALEADAEREPLPETADCVEAWTAGGDVEESLVILYVVESAQPAIAATKLAGLVAHHGFDAGGSATAYFDLHAERDHEHAAQSRAVLEEQPRSEKAEERLVGLGEAALRGNWRLLDGVERRCGREPR